MNSRIRFLKKLPKNRVVYCNFSVYDRMYSRHIKHRCQNGEHLTENDLMYMYDRIAYEFIQEFGGDLETLKSNIQIIKMQIV